VKKNDSPIALVPESFDASAGVTTPFGTRWGGQVIELAPEHLAALQAGQTLALDVQSEYVVFLKARCSSAATPMEISLDVEPASTESRL